MRLHTLWHANKSCSHECTPTGGMQFIVLVLLLYTLRTFLRDSNIKDFGMIWFQWSMTPCWGKFMCIQECLFSRSHTLSIDGIAGMWSTRSRRFASQFSGNTLFTQIYFMSLQFIYFFLGYFPSSYSLYIFKVFYILMLFLSCLAALVVLSFTLAFS